MRDISLQILHKATGGYSKGDTIGVYKTSLIADWHEPEQEYRLKEPISSQRTGFVHVTSIPTTATRKLRIMLDTHYHPSPDPDDPHAGGRQFQRKWNVLIDALPAALKQRFLEELELTFHWSQVKSYIQSRVTGQPISDEDVQGAQAVTLLDSV